MYNKFIRLSCGSGSFILSSEWLHSHALSLKCVCVGGRGVAVCGWLCVCVCTRACVYAWCVKSGRRCCRNEEGMGELQR